MRINSKSKSIFALSILTLVSLTACNGSLDSSTGSVLPNVTSGNTNPGTTSVVTGTPTPASTDTSSTASPTPVPTSTPVVIVTPTPTPTPTSTTSGYPSCINSDTNHICIGLKVVSYQDSSGVPVLTEADALTLVDGMNNLWSQCNIAFQLEVFQIIDPSTVGLPYSPNWSTETNAVRTQFKDGARFLVAAVGPWSVSTIAVTMMPGSGIYGTIVDKQYSHNPLTVGHELGHYQGLYHVSDTSNLMSAYIGNNTKALTTSQCTTARSTDNSDWQLMMRKPI